MNTDHKKTVLAAMAIIADATNEATDEGLKRLFNAYNHLHEQVDGQRIKMPVLSASQFRYDPKTQMIRGII